MVSLSFKLLLSFTFACVWDKKKKKGQSSRQPSCSCFNLKKQTNKNQLTHWNVKIADKSADICSKGVIFGPVILLLRPPKVSTLPHWATKTILAAVRLIYLNDILPKCPWERERQSTTRTVCCLTSDERHMKLNGCSLAAAKDSG